jgi:hypothetical protein
MSKIITLAISFDDSHLTFFAAFAYAVLHAQDTVVALIVQVLEDVLVIYFSSRRLLTAWIVAEMKGCDFVPGHIDVGNQVAFGDLLMIYVIDNLY